MASEVKGGIASIQQTSSASNNNRPSVDPTESAHLWASDYKAHLPPSVSNTPALDAYHPAFNTAQQAAYTSAMHRSMADRVSVMEPLRESLAQSLVNSQVGGL